jgi:hypothetical protein
MSITMRPKSEAHSSFRTTPHQGQTQCRLRVHWEKEAVKHSIILEIETRW